MGRVVVAGASGFIGTALTAELRRGGNEVVTVGRADADATWADPEAIAALVDGAEMVVNLAGRSVDCRYTSANRRAILTSRVDTTEALAVAIAQATAPPPLWINSSTATWYRHADDRPQTEADGEVGAGFSIDVGRAWERAFFGPELPGTRRVALRITIVLGRGGVMVPLVRLTRLGLGGAQRDGRWPGTPARLAAGVHHRFRASSRGGRQRFSWVHLDDVVRIVLFVREHEEVVGPLNVAAPRAVENRALMRLLRERVDAPIGLPAFRWMLELGAVAIRTETELVLKSRWVEPRRLLDAGFRFRHDDLADALATIVRPRGQRASRASS